jgi:two-component system response regulator MprA
MAMRTVLIVDDEPAVRDALDRALRTAGFAVRTAANGEEGLEAIADQHPDLVVLDVLMPVMDGFEACRRLRESGDRTRC